MKKFILFFLILQPLASFAQGGYRPLVEQGKKWTYHHDDYQHAFDYYYTLEGDTVVAGIDCLKMYSDNKNDKGETLYEGALFEDNKKVYCFFPDKDEAELLYDFDCEIGDTVKSMVVKDIRTDTISTVVKRYLFEAYLVSDDGEESHVLLGDASWIEGVGSEMDFFNMLPMAGNYNSLVACEVNGEVLFKIPPSAAIHNARSCQPDENGAIFDLQGRRLQSIPTKGFYIHNGKKWIIR